MQMALNIPTIDHLPWRGRGARFNSQLSAPEASLVSCKSQPSFEAPNSSFSPLCRCALPRPARIL
jgi:hypothetical protein